MSSLRERLLAEGIKNRLIGIQKSEQIYKKLSKLEKNALKMNEKDIDRIANLIAEKVESYAILIEEKTGAQPEPQQIIAKIKDELEKIKC